MSGWWWMLILWPLVGFVVAYAWGTFARRAARPEAEASAEAEAEEAGEDRAQAVSGAPNPSTGVKGSPSKPPSRRSHKA